MRTKSMISLLLVTVLTFVGTVSVQGQSPKAPSNPTWTEMPLIELGLTTNRSETKSADGAFNAIILAKSGLVAALYNCQINVEQTVEQWAKKHYLTLMERKVSSITNRATISQFRKR